MTEMIAENIILNESPDMTLVSTQNINPDRLEAEYYKPKYIKFMGDISYLSTKRLGELGEHIKDGPGGWGIKTTDYVQSGIPMLRTVNIVDGLLDLKDSVFITAEKQEELTRSRVKKNDVLLSVRGTIGKSTVYTKEFEANINAAIVKITIGNDKVDPYYLSVFLNSKYGMLQTERIANGAVQQNMNLSEVKSNIIPVPTEQIQGFIGNKVREAERLKDEAQKIRKNFEQEIDELFGSLKNKDGKYIFVDKEDLNVERLDADYYSPRNVLAQKLVLVSSSEKKLLSDVAFITDGDHGSPAFVHEGVPFLRNKNVKKYLVDEKDIVFINPEYEEQLKSSRLRKNDLLLKKIGTVGDCAVFRGTTGNLNANSALIRLETNKLLPYFTCALLNSSVFKTIIEREAGGGVQMALSLGKLFNIQIPIFKLAIQEPINEKVKKYIKMMEHSKDLIQEAKQDVEDLIEGNFTMEDN